jgi:tRNA (guanine26-N2/guanine27-N2)-dimethyltransferase
MITECKSKLDVKIEKKVSKKMETFYNPVMKFNRDISVLLLNSVSNKDMQIGLPLAGSGIRGIRFLKELDKNKIKTIYFNDISSDAIKNIKKNLKLNKISLKKVIISNQDANLFLLNSNGFDYIDIDPFGSPNMFLNNSIIRLAREGILAVTATDTAALTGTYTKVCRRKYWAEPLRTEIMHEIGLRILIRKVQLVGSQFEKALIPIVSYSKDHYYRVFFKCIKSKKMVDSIVKYHGMFKNAGPMWLGSLWDTKLISVIEKNNPIEENKKILKIMKDESKIDIIGFYDLNCLGKKYKLKKIPKLDYIIKVIKKKGFSVSLTHFRENSIRTDISEKELIKILRN